MHFFAQYFLFLAKAVTFVVAILVIVGGIIVLISKGRSQKEMGKINIKHLNTHFTVIADTLNAEILPKEELKKRQKAEKKAKKKPPFDKRIFVLNFNGDIRAQAVSAFREEITAVLSIAHTSDEVMVRLESPGGLVHAYGLAASQLQRIKDRHIPLTVAVDKVAASGGYLMACVANKILAAPFAIVGSIGVLAQLPNFNRLLKKHDVDYEQITAGQYKRTLTMFGKNTDQGREKFQEQVEDTHELFKSYVKDHRPVVDLNMIGTGEYWYGTRALALHLVDHLQTSDDYLMNAAQVADLYEITFEDKKSLKNKLLGIFGSVYSLMNSENYL